MQLLQQENVEKSRFEPVGAQMDLLCRKITSHTGLTCLSLLLPRAKGRAGGISSHQNLILLGGGKNSHQIQPSSLCLEMLGWQGAAGAGEQQEGDPAGQDSAGKSSLAQAEPPLTPQMWENSAIFALGLLFFECYKLCCKEKWE